MERVKYGQNQEFEDEVLLEELEDAADFYDRIIKEEVECHTEES